MNNAKKVHELCEVHGGETVIAALFMLLGTSAQMNGQNGIHYCNILLAKVELLLDDKGIIITKILKDSYAR